MNPRTVWLASYPKSGNTWFRAVFVAWRSSGPVDLNQLRARGIGGIASSRARIDGALGIPSSLMTADEIDLLRPRAEEVIGGLWGQTAADDVEDDVVPEAVPASQGGTDAHEGVGRLCKIHDALFCGPAGEPIVSLAATRAAIYVVRDPRDVAVSLAHHNGWSLERAVEDMGDPKAGLSRGRKAFDPQVRQRMGTWSEHVRSWLDQAWIPVHVVRYEDCRRAPGDTFAGALRFAGFDADPSDVTVAAETVRFERLQSQEAEGGFRERPAQAERFFRRGVVGAWRDELAAQLAAQVEADHRDVMRRLGYLPEPEPDRA